MKKAFLIGCAALLALAVFSCGNFTAPEAKDDGPRVKYAADGTKLVRLDINFKGNGRALTDNMAMVAAERYEVAFSRTWDDDDDSGTPDVTTVYRTSWADGERGRLWVATSSDGIDYDSTDNSNILFAGYSNGTVLAVGKLSSVDTAPGGTTIKDSSRSVTFTLTPLTNDIYSADVEDPDHPGDFQSRAPETSTFQITEAGFKTADLDVFPKAKINGFDYPVYELDNGIDVTATYAIAGLPKKDEIVIAATPRVIPKLIVTKDYFTAADVTGSFDSALDHSSTAPGTLLPPPDTDGVTTFELTLNTKTNEGLIKICFEIPVNALSIAQGYNDVTPGKWYIRGGISNTALDMGVAQDSDGGAVLVGVGNYTKPSEDGWINVDTD